MTKSLKWCQILAGTPFFFVFIIFTNSKLSHSGGDHHGNGAPATVDTSHREDCSFDSLSDGAVQPEFHPNSIHQYKVLGGQTFMDGFDADTHAEERRSNTFYPFASRGDWELASWLYNSGLSMAEIDKFLSLEFVSFF